MRLTSIVRDGFTGAGGPRAWIALCGLLAGCVSVPSTPTVVAAGPPAQLPLRAPSAGPPQQRTSVDDPPQMRVALADEASATAPAQPERPKACIRLASGTGIPAGPAPAHDLAEAPSQAKPPAEIPDPASGGTGKSGNPAVAAAKPSTPGNLGPRIAARSAQLSLAAAADARAEKAAEAGRTARAAELYAADWQASPGNWSDAAKAVELWARVGDYLSAEILLKAVIAEAGSTQQPQLADQAQALDKKLNVAAGAAAEADRLWRRTFALEPEGRYTEAVALLRRLQEFDPTAPGYYIREASFFARCDDAPHAADAIARGSAAGVSYAGRWAPARDPSLVRLWPNPKFQAAIRDTLGEAAVEDFEEHLTAR
jgi:hypothetical protein